MRDEDRLVINANLQRLLSDKQSLQEELEIHQQQKASLSEALVVANQQLARDAQLREELETLRREYGSSAEARVELAAVQERGATAERGRREAQRELHEAHQLLLAQEKSAQRAAQQLAQCRKQHEAAAGQLRQGEMARLRSTRERQLAVGEVRATEEELSAALGRFEQQQRGNEVLQRRLQEQQRQQQRQQEQHVQDLARAAAPAAAVAGAAGGGGGLARSGSGEELELKLRTVGPKRAWPGGRPRRGKGAVGQAEELEGAADDDDDEHGGAGGIAGGGIPGGIAALVSSSRGARGGALPLPIDALGTAAGGGSGGGGGTVARRAWQLLHSCAALVERSPRRAVAVSSLAAFALGLTTGIAL